MPGACCDVRQRERKRGVLPCMVHRLCTNACIHTHISYDNLLPKSHPCTHISTYRDAFSPKQRSYFNCAGLVYTHAHTCTRGPPNTHYKRLHMTTKHTHTHHTHTPHTHTQNHSNLSAVDTTQSSGLSKCWNSSMAELLANTWEQTEPNCAERQTIPISIQLHGAELSTMSPSPPDVAGDFEGVGRAACLCLTGVIMSFVGWFDPRVCWYFVERPRIFTLKHLDRKAVWRLLRDMGYGSSHPDLLASFGPLLHSHTHTHIHICMREQWDSHICTHAQLKKIIHYNQIYESSIHTYNPNEDFTAQMLLCDRLNWVPCYVLPKYQFVLKINSNFCCEASLHLLSI